MNKAVHKQILGMNYVRKLRFQGTLFSRINLGDIWGENILNLKLILVCVQIGISGDKLYLIDVVCCVCSNKSLVSEQGSQLGI